MRCASNHTYRGCALNQTYEPVSPQVPRCPRPAILTIRANRTSPLQQQIERIMELPRAQQRFVMQMLDTVLAQQGRYSSSRLKRGFPMTSRSAALVPVEHITQSIPILRRQRVILDSDLVAIYGVSTARLNAAVKRNAERFPEDFMFRLSAPEQAALISQIHAVS